MNLITSKIKSTFLNLKKENIKIILITFLLSFVYYTSQIGEEVSTSFLGTPKIYLPGIVLTTALAFWIKPSAGIFPKEKLTTLLPISVIALTFFMSAFPEAFIDQTYTALSILIVNLCLLSLVISFARLHDWNLENYSLTIAFLFLLVALLHSLVAVLSFHNIAFHGLQSLYYIRLEGLPGNPNFLGQIITPGLVSAVFLFFRFQRRQQQGITLIALLTVLIFLSYSLLLTGSRGGILGFIIAFLTFSIAQTQKPIKKVLYIILAVLIVFSLFILAQWMVNQGWVRGKLFELGEGSGRIGIWMTAWNIFYSSDFLQTIFGHGNGFLSRSLRSSHSVYVRFLVDYGIVGIFALFLFVIGSISVFLRKTKTHAEVQQNAFFISGFTLVFSTGLVNNSIFGGMTAEYIFFMFIYGILFCKSKPKKMKITKKSKLQNLHKIY
jgi:O-antigen ligase